MKTALKIAAGLGAISALSGLASTAYAQNTATATATGSATILQSISVTPSANLGFGAIVKPSTGVNTITVSSTGNNRSVSGGGNAVVANAGGVSSAAFLIQGEGGSAVSLTVPATFNMTSGADSLVVTTTSTATSGNLSGSIGAQGSFTVGVGGSFQLSTSTTSGAYSGNLVVTAQYN